MPLTVNGVDESSSADKPRHNKNAALGMKNVLFAREILLSQEDAASFELDEEITLMNWRDAIIIEISADPSGLVSGLELRLHLESDFKKREKKVTWLAKEPMDMIPVDLVDFDYLITKEKSWERRQRPLLAPYTKCRIADWCLGRLQCCESSRHDIIRFDRIGYFRVDQAYQR